MFFVVRRATLLIPSGSADDPNRKHFFICLTDPVGNSREALLVSASTLKEGEPFDPACKLFPGDHPFIKRESYIAYRFAAIYAAGKLENGVAKGLFVPLDSLDGAIYARVCQGLEASRFLAPRFLEFYQNATKSNER
jgi:hypothetical protein